VGYAYALKLHKKNAVVVSFFGDGATEEGVFHESMNFASLKNLPIIFICENNLYAIHTHWSSRRKISDIYERARAYQIPAERIEDNDVLAIMEKVGHAVASLRAGNNGPFFFECMTYRFREHVGPNEDFQLGYRTREEAVSWIENDPLVRVAALVDAQVRRCIEAETEAEIQDAFSYAEAGAFPCAAELVTDVFEA
jgi:TPP-dependent pyruvate/acetoin dehydrogenase alpha subunit